VGRQVPPARERPTHIFSCRRVGYSPFVARAPPQRWTNSTFLEQHNIAGGIMPTPQTESRHATPLVPILMTQLDTPTAASTTDWLWHGLIARGNVTLFTSQWKAGKSTLLTGLMHKPRSGTESGV
jgi:hypothetical protein